MSTKPSTPNPQAFDTIANTDAVFGRVVVPVPNQNKPLKNGKLGFEYAEHAFIGDSITLTLANGNKVAAHDHKFTLSNKLALTYGQINALAGDFYGTSNPISDGKDDQDRSARFVAAYGTLATDTSRQPQEANEILGVLQAEVDAVNKALENHEDPSKAYAILPDVSWKLQAITITRKGIPGYLGLAQINWDHFGDDARTAYNAGHATAIQKAISGDLEGAYTLNAFADHFLEDSFSAGHLRTPRRLLHRSLDPTADLCAKYMHDEDCAIGFQVSNPAGQSWKCFGDRRALDKEDADNLKRCVAAVQASADEIYAAYKTETAPSPSNYAAWKIAPTLESARATTQELATLFTFKSEKRKDIEKRRIWNFKTDWWFSTTALECETSGWWVYPITIDGPHLIIPWSGISVVTPSLWSLRVFYQMPNGGIIQSVHANNKWTTIHDRPIVDAVPFSPLASVTWDDGKEIRLYYLDNDYIVQEYCYSDGTGWFAGEIGQLGAKARYNSQLGAIVYGDDDGGIHIRVYYQEDGTNVIAELYNDGDWGTGELRLPGALEGTNIAVVTYNFDQTQTRIYYQREDLSLGEHCHDDSGWYKGDWNPGKVPGGTPIGAVAFGNVIIQVYWRNSDGKVVFSENTGDWGSAKTVLANIPLGFQFSVLQWEDGQFLRLYYQNAAGFVLEQYSDDGGNSWSAGELKVGGIVG